MSVATIIHKYKFTMLERYDHSRQVVKMMSSNLDNSNEKVFFVYRSVSESGLWRLCVSKGDMYMKGSDYITITFVHMRLQKFINKNLSKVKVVEHPENTLCLSYEEDVLNEIEHIINERHMVGNDVFRPLNHPSINCGVFLKSAGFYDGFGEFLENNAGSIYFDKMMSILVKNINSSRNDGKITLISEYLNNFFSVDLDNISDIGESVFSYGNLKIEHKFKSVIATEKYTGDKFEVIFSDYIAHHDLNYKSIDSNKKMPFGLSKKLAFVRDKDGYGVRKYNYKIIINIVPKSNGDCSDINKYGLYRRVISAGATICKPIEYRAQSSEGIFDIREDIIDENVIFEDDQSDEYKKIIEKNNSSWSGYMPKYKFFGDMMTQMWFLPKLPNNSYF